jgi:transposase
LAQARRGRQNPSRIDEFELTTLVGALVDALTQPHLGLDKVIDLLAPRAAYPLLVQLPSIGTPTAAAILTAIGALHAYHNGTQLGTLAGLDLRLFESGSSIRKLPKISQVGRASLRDWLSH